MNNNIDCELLEIIDLLDFTLSNKFIEKWNKKYSDKFIRNFQFKLRHSLQRQKPLKRSVLTKYLVNKCKYGEKQVENFFETIDITIYTPIITLD